MCFLWFISYHREDVVLERNKQIDWFFFFIVGFYIYDPVSYHREECRSREKQTNRSFFSSLGTRDIGYYYIFNPVSSSRRCRSPESDMSNSSSFVRKTSNRRETDSWRSSPTPWDLPNCWSISYSQRLPALGRTHLHNYVKNDFEPSGIRHVEFFKVQKIKTGAMDHDQRWTNAGEEFREGLAIAAVPVGGP